ncbi:molybdopterin cofactor-binding domain-containing protein [Massilia psychrophila]|uniref:molybdopterin cofactor-binding domain-containing protein n=1 Tax=Massilia psychrophila TaxID=1603353 RepID=UPI0015D4ED07|nr:molybdopterin cofactor-binding domain-containing protein [Massilia psychrophila]
MGAIRVPLVAGACGVGKSINKKTGHSQLMGGIVWRLGMVLMEKTEFDWHTGIANVHRQRDQVRRSPTTNAFNHLAGASAHWALLSIRGTGAFAAVAHRLAGTGRARHSLVARVWWSSGCHNAP